MIEIEKNPLYSIILCTNGISHTSAIIPDQHLIILNLKDQKRGDFIAQTKNVFSKIEMILASNDLGKEHIRDLQVNIVGRNKKDIKKRRDTFNILYRAWVQDVEFPDGELPTRAIAIVPWASDALIQIQITKAVKNLS